MDLVNFNGKKTMKINANYRNKSKMRRHQLPEKNKKVFDDTMCSVCSNR